MKIIARIPCLDVQAPVVAAPPRPEASPSRAPSAVATNGAVAAVDRAAADAEGVWHRGDRSSGRRPTFPMGSVIALAVLAAVVWSFASWNDARRLARSRQDRLADVPWPTTTDLKTR